MADDAIIDLSMLLDNGLIKQFEEFDVPCVLLPEFILEGLVKSAGRILKKHEDPKPLPAMIAALLKLVGRVPEKSVSRYKISRYTALFEGIIYCIDDKDLIALRGGLFDLFKRTLNMFDFTGRYLIIRHLFKRVADGELKLSFEPQVLAWMIDLYRNQLAFNDAQIFRDELTFFYNDISKVHYREVELCHPYLNAVTLLAQFQASINFNKPLLKAVKDKVLDPIYTQIDDFRTLTNLQEEGEKFENMEFLLFNLSYAKRVIDKALHE